MTVSLLTFLADLLCVAWGTKGMLDDLKCYTDITSQDQIRSKALLHLARKLLEIGPMKRVRVVLAPGEGGGQWQKMALWQMALQLMKVDVLEVGDQEGVECLAELVRSLGEENLEDEEVDWLREHCTEIRGCDEICRAWADMCCTAGIRALQKDAIKPGVGLLLQSAWTLSRIIPEKRMDLPLGPVGGPLQILREEASKLCNDFLDALYEVIRKPTTTRCFDL